MLAYCRLAVPECGRIPGDEGKIGIYLPDGGVAAVDGETMQPVMPDHSKTGWDVCNMLRTSIHEAHKELADSGEMQMER